MDDAVRKKWLAKLARLRTNPRGSPAPHKPLLLLVVIELAEQGVLPPKVLPLTPELAFRFCTYWCIVARRRRQKPDIRYPFFHMTRDGCWVALDEDGKPATHHRLARCAELNPEFEQCLHDPAFREEARRVLICQYFPMDERSGLCSLLDMAVPTDLEAAGVAARSAIEKAQERAREAGFRLRVVPAYNYTCALTGYRLSTIPTSGSIIDAAHIHQFADSRNNDIRNGIALCKNAHWLFDNGLWTIAEDYTVKVALHAFSEDSPDQRPLSDYQGSAIRLPNDPALHPNQAYLAWHRKQKFLGGG